MDNINKTSTIVSVMQSLKLMTYSWYDYVLFVLILGLSSAIGVYFGCFGNKQSTIKEYLLGDRTMTAVPIAFSLVAR